MPSQSRLPIRRAVLLLSGGLDSTTLLALARRDGFEIHALTFRYGQRHASEVEAARRVAYDFGSDVSSRTIAAKVINNGYRNNEVATITTTALTAGESINVDVVEVPLRVRSSRSLKPASNRPRC